MPKPHVYNATITCGGESHTISEWARILNIPAGTIYSRRKLGQTDEECLTVGRRRGYAQSRNHPWKAGLAT